MVKAGGRKGKKKVKKEIAKLLNKGKVGQNILATSGYFMSIADPFNIIGQKIPDWVNYPSSTFSVTFRAQYSSSVAGNLAICFGLSGNASNTASSLVPVQWLVSVMGTNAFPIGMVNQTTSVSTDLFPSAASTSITLPAWTGSGIPAIYSKARLVSAGFAIDYTGPALTATGTFTAVSLPRNHWRSTASAGAITLNNLQNSHGARIVPINRLAGATTVYHPQDETSWRYTDLSLSYDNASLTTFAAVEGALGGEVYLIVSGGLASTSYQITAVLNYEGIPKQSTFNLIQPTAHKSDPLELAATMNAMPFVPTAHEGTLAVQGIVTGSHEQLPMANSPNHSAVTSTAATAVGGSEQTFMEKLLGGADSLSSLIDKGMGLAQKIAPLAESALALL